MQAQWCLVDGSRHKRSSEEDIGVSSKRQRRIQSQPESPDKCEDVPQIRGGLARPRPPELGPPPNRARIPASQAGTTDPTASKTAQTANTSAPPKTAPRPPRIIDSDEEDDVEEDWRSRTKAPANTNQPGTTGGFVNTKGTSTTLGPPPGLTGTQGTTKPPIQPPKVSEKKKPLPPTQDPPQLPTPPKTDPSNQKQGTNTGAGTGTGGPGGIPSTTAPKVPTVPTVPTAPPGPLPSYPEESEILELYRRLQEMVVIWVEECLPDTFPGEFKDNRPERYWELCGWCQPLKLGNSMLADRSWAKYTYESWVWRFLYSEIFQPGSLAWAGDDFSMDKGGAGGAGKRTNDNFKSLFDRVQDFMTATQYRTHIDTRANMMNQVRNGLISRDRYRAVTSGLVTEMLVAFHPYFSDAYKPTDQPQNIEVLIRDTRFLIVKARELDEKLRSARHVYDFILGKPGKVCEISGVDSQAVQRYDPARPDYLENQSSIALIVVPGVVKYDMKDSLYASDDYEVKKVVVRRARAFERADLRAVMPSFG